MKKLLALLLILLLAIPPVSAEPALLGGWKVTSVSDSAVSASLLDTFETTLSGMLGCEYLPVRVLATQLVSGTNYCFLTLATPVSPEAVPHWALVYLHVPLEGNAELMEIRDLSLTGEEGEGASLLGGWQPVSAPDQVLDADSLSACEKAVAGMVGCGYEPLTLLATQTVAGLNRCVLAQLTPVVPDPQPYWALMYVYTALDGTSTLVDVTDLSVSPAAE